MLAGMDCSGSPFLASVNITQAQNSGEAQAGKHVNEDGNPS
jgi:hypothetical protein